MGTALTPTQLIGYEQAAGFPTSALAEGLAVADVESGLDPTAKNPSGATGLFQVMPGHLSEPGMVGPLTDATANTHDAFLLWSRAGNTFDKDWIPNEPTNAVQDKMAWATDAVNAYLTGHGQAGTPGNVAPGSIAADAQQITHNLMAWFLAAIIVIFLVTR